MNEAQPPKPASSPVHFALAFAFMCVCIGLAAALILFAYSQARHDQAQLERGDRLRSFCALLRPNKDGEYPSAAELSRKLGRALEHPAYPQQGGYVYFEGVTKNDSRHTILIYEHLPRHANLAECLPPFFVDVGHAPSKLLQLEMTVPLKDLLDAQSTRFRAAGRNVRPVLLRPAR